MRGTHTCAQQPDGATPPVSLPAAARRATGGLWTGSLITGSPFRWTCRLDIDAGGCCRIGRSRFATAHAAVQALLMSPADGLLTGKLAQHFGNAGEMIAGEHA